MALRPRDIVKGEFIQIVGVTRNEDGIHFLCQWTTGQCYIPINLMKKYFPAELIEYYKDCSTFVRI